MLSVPKLTGIRSIEEASLPGDRPILHTERARTADYTIQSENSGYVAWDCMTGRGNYEEALILRMNILNIWTGLRDFARNAVVCVDTQVPRHCTLYLFSSPALRPFSTRLPQSQPVPSTLSVECWDRSFRSPPAHDLCSKRLLCSLWDGS